MTQRLNRVQLAARPLLAVALGAILLAAVELAGSSANSSHIIVDSDLDSIPTKSGDGRCTLREAIINANADADLTSGDCAAGSAADTIQISVAGGSIIQLSGTALPTITQRLTIDGSPTEGLSISGEAKSRIFVIGASTDVTITHLAITNGQENWGAGILNDGQLLLANTSFLNNSAGIEPGGAVNNRNGTLSVYDSTFSNNSSWQGGAIMSSSGPVKIYNSTFEGSSARYGGAIFHSRGTMEVHNSTFSGNAADSFGGAIDHASKDGLIINSSTFNLNTANHDSNLGGGSINVYAGKTLHMTNSILANSIKGHDCVIAGTFGTNSGNLVRDGTCSPFIAVDPKLGLLQDNGGPTETHALLAESPAIDGGDIAYCPASDQRGVARDVKCDIGAYEYQGPREFLFIPLVSSG